MTFRSQAIQNNENGYLKATRRQKCRCRIMHFYVIITRNIFSKLLQHIWGTIFNDIYALRLCKWTLRTGTMQNTAKGNLAATQPPLIHQQKSKNMVVALEIIFQKSYSTCRIPLAMIYMHYRKKKLTFRSHAMQNNENGYLTASRWQKCHCRILQ